MWPLIAEALRVAKEALAKVNTILSGGGSGGGGSGGPTIYSGDGTIADERTVNCGGQDVYFRDFTKFYIESDPTQLADRFTYIDCSPEADGKVVIGSAVPGFTKFVEMVLDAPGTNWEVTVSNGTDTHDISAFGSAGTVIKTTGSGSAHLRVNASGIKVGDTGEKVGFYGTSPISRQTISDPTTLAELRTILLNLGLVVPA